MSNDPATLLRQSEQLELPAVLEIGHANAAAVPLMLTDPVVIPVELEWTGGEASDAPNRARAPMGPSSAPGSPPAQPVSARPQPVGMAPVAIRPSRRRGRFLVGN